VLLEDRAGRGPTLLEEAGPQEQLGGAAAQHPGVVGGRAGGAGREGRRGLGPAAGQDQGLAALDQERAPRPGVRRRVGGEAEERGRALGGPGVERGARRRGCGRTRGVAVARGVLVARHPLAIAAAEPESGGQAPVASARGRGLEARGDRLADPIVIGVEVVAGGGDPDQPDRAQVGQLGAGHRRRDRGPRDRQGDRTAGQGDDGQERLASDRQRRGPSPDHVVDGGPGRQPAVGQRQLADEKRAAAGLARDRRGVAGAAEVPRDLGAGRQIEGADHDHPLGHAGAIESGQDRAGGHVLAAAAGQAQDRWPVGAAHQLGQELAAVAVAPLQIVEPQDQAVSRRHRGDERARRAPGPPPQRPRAPAPLARSPPAPPGRAGPARRHRRGPGRPGPRPAAPPGARPARRRSDRSRAAACARGRSNARPAPRPRRADRPGTPGPERSCRSPTGRRSAPPPARARRRPRPRLAPRARGRGPEAAPRRRRWQAPPPRPAPATVARTSTAPARPAGSRARRRSTSAAIAGGAPGASEAKLGAGPACLAARTSSAAPTNGGRPAQASNSIAPSAYQSAAGPSGAPATCSGAMNHAVPAVATSPRSATRPKSHTRRRPAPSTRTLLGLRSQCRRPAAWTASRASASWASAAAARAGAIAAGATGVAPWTPSPDATVAIARRAATQPARQIGGVVDQLHREVPLAIDVAELVEADQVGMGEVAQGAELALEARQRRRGRAAQELERQAIAALVVDHLVDRAEAAGAEQRAQAVVAEARQAHIIHIIVRQHASSRRARGDCAGDGAFHLRNMDCCPRGS
jgi:hypothetical protein